MAAAPAIPPCPADLVDRLRAIWSRELGGVDVPADGNFFRLGGRSLTAVRVVHAVSTEFGLSVPAQTVFDAPSPREFADLLTTTAATSMAGPSESDTDAAPLSWQQEWQYRIEQAVSGSNIYASLGRFTLTGPLDRAAFDAAWLAVVSRHAVLRTRYREAGGALTQVTNPHPVYELVEHDLVGLSAAERDERHRQVFREFTTRGFDLAADAGLRVLLTWLSAEVAEVVLSVHHINFDGWSRDVLLNDFVAAYGGADLPPAMRYADFARWQRQHIDGPAVEEHLRFWGDTVGDGAPRSPERGSDEPSYLSRRADLTVPAAATRGLVRLAQDEGTTPFSACLAVFGVVLARWLGTRSLPVATITANRAWAATNDMVGMFMTVLPIRVSTDHPTFRDMVAATGRSVAQTMQHQEYPLEHAYLCREPTLSRALTGGLRYGIALHPAFRADRELAGGLVLTQLPPHLDARSGEEADPSTFEVTLELRESPTGLIGHLAHQVDAVTPETAARLAHEFVALAELAAARPDTPLAEVVDSRTPC